MQITRRSALATGAAAITTAAITAPLAIKSAGVKAALAGDPVIDLAAQVKAAYRAHVETHDTYEDVAHDAGYNICADFEMTTGMTTNGERYSWSREQVLKAAARDEEWAVRITPEERDRALAAIDAHRHHAARARHDLGLDPLRERKDQTRAHWLDLEARMLDTPALTVAGVLAKVQSWYCDHEIEAMRRWEEPDHPLETDLSASVYRDLARLAGNFERQIGGMRR